jgi:salicylate 5-hydroxylase large subunit
MRLRRTRQANLFGPAGLVSADDSEIIEMSQQGFGQYPDEDALVIMGGRGMESVEHMATEVGIRGMYRYWREAMGYD